MPGAIVFFSLAVSGATFLERERVSAFRNVFRRSAAQEVVQTSGVNQPEFENVESVLIEMTTKVRHEKLFEPPATVALGLCSAVIPEVSNDSLFIVWEMQHGKTCLVRFAKEFACEVCVF